MGSVHARRVFFREPSTDYIQGPVEPADPQHVVLKTNESLSTGVAFLYRAPAQQPSGDMVWLVHAHADKFVFSIDLPAHLSFLQLFRQLKVMGRAPSGEAAPLPVQEPYEMFGAVFADVDARISTGFLLQTKLLLAVGTKDGRWFLSSAAEAPIGPDTAEVIRLPEGTVLTTRVMVAYHEGAGRWVGVTGSVASSGTADSKFVRGGLTLHLKDSLAYMMYFPVE